MTALERIARALAAQHWRDAGASEEQVLAFADIDWPEFVPDARAALTALREPDEAMMKAAAATEGMRAIDGMIALQAARGYPLRTSQDGGDKSILELAWAAAIDAALQEGQ